MMANLSGFSIVFSVLLILVFVSSVCMARPLDYDVYLRTFVNSPEVVEPSASFIQFNDGGGYRGAIKRQMQAFSEPTGNLGKVKAMSMLRAMINFRRY
ncbi:hypothetical protein M3Y98_00956000 [Aphelenchoides besseyi]|nr:hypothetical protein M3Y98_00956000 [Aphelenchoides besseyi]KAI6194621.1 hypothetical protein M3Y96_01144200 [Aphelenchoides besseyi]